METIDGKIYFQVKDLIEELQDYPEDSIVFAIGLDRNNMLYERPVYKTIETADPGEVYLYLGDRSGRKINN